jgi:hypothetical protein
MAAGANGGEFHIRHSKVVDDDLRKLLWKAIARGQGMAFAQAFERIFQNFGRTLHLYVKFLIDFPTCVYKFARSLLLRW